jgi:hypothetical protein
MTSISLQWLGSLPLDTGDGQAPEPMWSEHIPARTVEAALAICGRTVKEINRSWHQQKASRRQHAQLEPPVVFSFFPAGGTRIVQRPGNRRSPVFEVQPLGDADPQSSRGSYPALCAYLIEVGPARTHQLFWDALGVYAVTPMAGGPNAGRLPSVGTLGAYYSGFRRFMSVVQHLARGPMICAPGASSVDPRLQAWRDIPDRMSKADIAALCQADNGGRTDRSGPGILVARRALRWADDQVHVLRKTGRPSERQLLAALRNRALLGLLMVTASREGAVFADHDQERTRVCHYDPEHTFVFPGVQAPVRSAAFCIHPARKGVALKPTWIGIPPELARWIEEYLEEAGISSRGDLPIWVSSQRFGGSEELVPLGKDSLDKIIKKAFSAVRGGAPHSPHTLRHSPGEPTATVVGEEWLAGRLPADLVGLPEVLARPLDNTDKGRLTSGRVIADALLSHSFASEDRNGYRNLEDHRERLAMIGAYGMWAHVWGSLSGETEPDSEAILGAEAALLEARAALEEVQADLAVKALEIKDTRTEAELQATNPGLSGDERLAAFWAFNLRYIALTEDRDQLREREREAAIQEAHAQAVLEKAMAMRRPIEDQWIPDLPDDAPVKSSDATLMVFATTGRIVSGATLAARLRRAGCAEMNPHREAGASILWRFADVRAHLLEAGPASGSIPHPDEILSSAATLLKKAPRPATQAERLADALEIRDTMTQAEAALAFFGPDVSHPTIKRAMNGETKTGPFEPVRHIVTTKDGREVVTDQPICVLGDPGSHTRRVRVTQTLKRWLLANPQHCEYAIAILTSEPGTHVADYAKRR